MYGDNLVVWLGIETTSSVDISIAPSGGSGQFVDRAPPPDFGYDFDTNVPPLPMGSPEPGPFGAYYTHLKFNNRFDELWRVGDDTDVVVQFDDNAHRFVFWRGTNYGPHWVSDTNETSYSNWYGTQFVERRASEWGGSGCCAEPMQDWDCRYAHARIISSNPARAIVQWRYASCDRNYDIVRDGGGDVWGDWDEEYFTIYPDAISVRKVTAYSSRTGGSDMESPHIEYHEAIPVTNPGTVPEDNIHWNALSATNYAGNKRDWVAQDVDGGAMTNLHEITDKPIMVVRMKGSTVPVSIVEGTSVEHDPVGQHDCRPFNAYDDWPAWPDADRSGGAGGWYWDEDPDTHCYRNFWTKYPSHCSILHLKWDDYEHQTNVKRTKVMLFGMFDAAQAANVNNLIPLARSWQYPPALSITSAGFTDGSYDKTERAYKILRTSPALTTLQFTLQGSSNSPIINPCFVVENWWGDTNAGLTIDGQPIAPGHDFRQGIEKTADGVSSLVIWLRKDSTSPVDICVIPSVQPLEAAYSPSPPDGAENVHPNVVLKWKPGQHTASHDVYFGTSFDSVNDANITLTLDAYMGTQNLDANSYDPCGFLELGTAYYWRIDEVNEGETLKGQVWRFRVDDGKARNPNPVNGGWSASTNTILSWTPGVLAAAHDVYFGTNFDSVNDANTTLTLDTYMGTQNLDASTYGCSGLEFAQTYYWRIDEVNDGSIRKGDVWSFAMVEYIVVDDVESYTPGSGSPHPISGVWIDGTTNQTGSSLDVGTAPGDPVHQGQQSMRYEYYNGFDFGAGYYSEIEHQYPDPCNWTALGVEALTLYFYGNPDNNDGDFEQMYVILEDSNGTYAESRYPLEDMNDIRLEDWQEWNIALADFTGVNLAAVKKLYIGFGYRGNWLPGGFGFVHFDDIILYPPRCILSYRSQELAAVDLSNNCAVDFADVKVMSDAWLQSGQNTADIYEDGVVNLKDFAVLANSWLAEQLWPSQE
ncbi:MAG: hypothetical protein ACYSTG_09025 [Planctomycetota bacterium]